jgi:subtilisin family serine protease
VSVAALNKTYVNATGTSFAAPLVAARFAMLLSRPDPAALLRAQQALQAEAVDLGAPGRDDVFGYGYLGIPPGLFLNASATH